ncbi:unnamed protein product [Rotaria socialis]|uniref:Uncharacterized protein n=1 Tax=Rotaria socialis TaxID=392032 RepID=A0A820EYX9_9BILA|nr:unnamed protein product [Rotaria socialis]CAF4253437.1 unnamed protein product [Rotaria socialis]CAF4496388.1 unnamed protein product [Rotaria socialis]
MRQRWYHLPVGTCFFLPFQTFHRLFCISCALTYLLFCLCQPVSSCFRTKYGKNALATLITTRFSHYCEKARWMLDLLQYVSARKSSSEQSENLHNDSHQYIECPRSILTRMVTSLWHTSEFSSSTPVDELCKLDNPTLYPIHEVEELESYFNQILGVHVRRYDYWLLFQADDIENELSNCWLRETMGFEK